MEKDLPKFKDEEIFQNFRDDIDCFGQETNIQLQIFSGDRKKHPYMIDENDLDQPIKRYSSAYTLKKELSEISKFDLNPERTARRKLLERFNDFSPKYKSKIVDLKSKKFDTGEFEFTEIETHVNFGGGKYGIPVNKEEEFLELYAKCVIAGHPAWLIEKNTKVRRMCLDFDFLQKSLIPFHQMEMLAIYVQKKIREFYPENDDDTRNALNCIVSTAKPTEKTKDNINYLKSGVHMHWNFYTNLERGFIIRETLISYLEKEFGKRIAPLEPWRKVIDGSIFNGSGLRLMGAHKAEKCPKCPKERKEKNYDCSLCKGQGAINVGRPYAPLFVMDIDGNRNFEKEKMYKENYVQLIKDTKIRTDKDDIPEFPHFIIPDGAPMPDPSEYSKPGKKVKKIKLFQPCDGIEQAKQIKGDTISLSNSEPEWDAIEEFINKHSLPIYKNIIIRELKTNINRSFFIVLVSGEYSRYCHNISREHSSNNIYFYITTDGMVQRCTDTENDGEMKFGVCAKYSSATIALTHSLQNVLFIKDKGELTPALKNDIKDKKLKMLMIMGNELCKSIFHTNWTLEDENGELLVSKNNQSKKFKKDIMLETMEEIFTSTYSFSKSKGDEFGTKSSEILLKLGFIDSIEKKRKDSIAKEEDETIYELESQAFISLKSLVEIACTLSKSEIEKMNIKNFS